MPTADLDIMMAGAGRTPRHLGHAAFTVRTRSIPILRCMFLTQRR